MESTKGNHLTWNNLYYFFNNKYNTVNFTFQKKRKFGNKEKILITI